MSNAPRNPVLFMVGDDSDPIERTRNIIRNTSNQDWNRRPRMIQSPYNGKLETVFEDVPLKLKSGWW